MAQDDNPVETAVSASSTMGTDDATLSDSESLDDLLAQEHRRQETLRARQHLETARGHIAEVGAKGLRPSIPQTEIAYPRDDPVGSRVGLPGAGIMAYIVGDQLHPPMVNDEAMWQKGERWKEGACLHTREAAVLAGLSNGERVIDIGCGVGGPARQLVREFGVSVAGITISPTHASTTQGINDRLGFNDKIEVGLADCRLRFPNPPYDCVWSLNMLYHVDDKEAMLRYAHEAIESGGRLMIDDWMVTNSLDVEARELLGFHWASTDFAVPTALEEQIERSGFVISQVVELGHVGRTSLARNFEGQLWSCFAPKIISDFPAAPGSGETSGRQMVEEFASAVRCTVDLYQADRLTYRRILAVA